MVGRQFGEIPAELSRGRDRFEAWRRRRKAGARIPDELWSLAVKLAEAHGVSRTASTLRLDYHSLKNRLASAGTESGSGAMGGRFLELSPALPGDLSFPLPGGSGECVVEFEDGSGARLRVHLRGCEVPDVVALGRSFWSGE
ncbi:MAG: hypothetical protein O2983_11715 [Planctomycetota bacterium]|nr:hypothetical protein [Planctomycetota bacterium]